MDTNKVDSGNWDIVLGETKSAFSLNIGEILRYKDLLRMFIVKDIITVYKQTILGPIWFVIQPIMTTVIYAIIFGRVANLAPDSVPQVLFFLGSVTLWNYFSDTLTITSKTFIDNANIFGKVYFPRIVLPLSKVMSGVIKFLIQFSLFVVCLIFFIVMHQLNPGQYPQRISPNIYMLLFPLIIAIIALLSFGFGVIITSMTTKYRDLNFLISFGVQLMMYATPVIYPITKISADKQIWLWLNPLTSLFEAFKYGFLGSGVLSLPWIGYSLLVTLVIVLYGMYTFNSVEKKFIDTV